MRPLILILALALALAVATAQPGDCHTDAECAAAHPGTNGDPE